VRKSCKPSKLTSSFSSLTDRAALDKMGARSTWSSSLKPASSKAAFHSFAKALFALSFFSTATFLPAFLIVSMHVWNCFLFSSASLPRTRISTGTLPPLSGSK